MNNEYDVFVIGTGTAGYTLAHQCRDAGKKVAVCDWQPMGGTCAMRGCQPKKYLVAATEIAGISHWMHTIGIAPEAKVKWADLMQSKNNFTDAVPQRVEKSFIDAGIDVFHGIARFISPDEITVSNDTTIKASAFVIATGSIPAPQELPGNKHIITSDDFLNLSALPQRIIFIGGGYISMEFAHIARIVGVEVTILERNERVLKRFEEETVNALMKSAEAAGIRIVTGYEVCEVSPRNSSYEVFGDENCTESYVGDLVVHGAGRVPAIDMLNLEAGNIAFSSDGIAVNDFMQSSSNPRVYAIGDVVAGSPLLSTVADMEAEVAAVNIVNGNFRQADYRNIPSVVFSFPPLATLGMTEEEAQSAGIEYEVNKGSMASWASSRRIGQNHAMYKVLMEKESGLLLGVHILGHNAGEIINVFALAMKLNLRGKDLKTVLWAYPTSTSDLKYMVG